MTRVLHRLATLPARARAFAAAALVVLAVTVFAHAAGLTFGGTCCCTEPRPVAEAPAPACCAKHAHDTRDGRDTLSQRDCGCGCPTLRIPGIPDFPPAEVTSPVHAPQTFLAAVPASVQPWISAESRPLPQAVRPPPWDAPASPLAASLPRLARC